MLAKLTSKNRLSLRKAVIAYPFEKVRSYPVL